MRVELAAIKGLFAFSAGDVIVFSGVAAIVLIVFAELGFPLIGMAAAVLGGSLGCVLDRAIDLDGAAQREHASQDECLQAAVVHGIASAGLDGQQGWLQRVLEIAPTDLDGLGS